MPCHAVFHPLHLCTSPMNPPSATCAQQWVAITLFQRMPQGSILLLRPQYFPMWPTSHHLHLPKVYFHSLLSNATFHFINFSLRASIVSVTNTKSAAYRISFINPSLAPSVTTSTTIAHNNGDNTDPWCTPTFTGNSFDNFVPTLTSLLDTGSSVPLPVFSGMPFLLISHPTTFLGTDPISDEEVSAFVF